MRTWGSSPTLFILIFAAFLDFDPPLEELLVDVDVKMDELGDLEQIIKPYIIDPVKRKIGETLKEEVGDLVRNMLMKDIPGLSAFGL